MTIAPSPARRAGLVPDSIIAQAVRGARQLAAALTRWRDRRKAIAQLRAMTDAQLRDIGIRRSEVDSVVRYGSTAPRRGLH